ncbi:MAG: YdcF family protein [Alphaproteobacteria bacterium]|nr:YdcF family protein [Alphaproteobacteria bacterium]MBF0252100.1 YdcF family protein [Alphaproteobacteria bacterium]
MRKPLRRNPGPTISRIGGALIVLAGIWGAGLFRYADAIPTEVSEPRQNTDAIVVLTGGTGRLDEGLRLLERGRARRLFVSGVYKGGDIRNLLEAYRRNPEDLDCCISIGHAEDTIGNASETRDWVRQNGIESVRLVTSAYHMPRSILEFENAMPDVIVFPHPVFPAHVKQEDWWAWPGTTGLIVGEYNKFLMAWLRHRLIGLL